MKWVGLPAGGRPTVFAVVVTAIWFQVVITAAFAPEADGTAATGVVTTRHMISDNAAAKRRVGWWAAVGVARKRMVTLRVCGGQLGISPASTPYDAPTRPEFVQSSSVRLAARALAFAG